jgi:hypothetical protein
MSQQFTNNGNGFEKGIAVVSVEPTLDRNKLPPAWCAFLRYCLELGHGEIERLKIQDGLPVIAEVTRRKIKFSA